MPGNRKQRGVHMRRYQLGDKRAALKPKQALRIGQADRKGKTPHFFSSPVCHGSGISRQGIQVGRAPREVVAVLEAVERRQLLLHQHRGRQDARVRGWHRSHLEPRGHKIRWACKLPLDGARGCLGPACRRSCPGRRLPSHPSTLGHTQGSHHMPSRSAGCALTRRPLARPRPLPAQPDRMAESGNGSRPSFGSAPSTCRTRSTRSSCYRRREYLTRKQTELEKSRNRGV